MSRDAFGLEQRCLWPGRWIIQGYQVRQRKGRWATRWASEWQIRNPDDSSPLGPGGGPVIVRTLGEARDWIWEHL